MFCCTHVEKCATVDHFETGCEIARQCVMDENVFIRAETMPKLIRKLNDRYCIEIDSLWIGALEDGRIGFNRLEDADGSEPSERQTELWKKGELTLCLCDYDFCIEKLVEQEITMDDFAGVTTHE